MSDFFSRWHLQYSLIQACQFRPFLITPRPWKIFYVCIKIWISLGTPWTFLPKAYSKTKSKKFYDKTRGHGVLFEQTNMLSLSENITFFRLCWCHVYVTAPFCHQLNKLREIRRNSWICSLVGLLINRNIKEVSNSQDLSGFAFILKFQTHYRGINTTFVPFI